MEDEFEDYDSGPFCRHWGDPSDCEEVCAACDHSCPQHSYYDDECNECDCRAFVDEEDADTLKNRASKIFGPY